MNYIIKYKKTFILIALLSIISMYYKITSEDRKRIGLSRNPYVFDTTRMSLRILDNVVNGDSSNWGYGMTVLVSPVALIMLPSNIVADTLLFPYDAYLWYRDSKHIKFWKNVHKQQLTTLAKNEYLQHYTDAVSPVVLRRIRTTYNEELIKIYFDVAAKKDDFKLSHQIIEGATEHGKKFPKLGEYMCTEAAKDINAPKFAYSIFLMLERHQYPQLCTTLLAEAGVKCSVLLYNKNLSEKYIRNCWQDTKTRYPQILAKNSGVPADIHEKIYNDSLKNITQEYGSRINTPVGRTQIFEDLARSTTSMKLIKQLHDLNDPRIDMAMLFNTAIPAEINERIREKQKERRR